MKKLFLIICLIYHFLFHIDNLNGQVIITVQSKSMIEKSIAPFAILDTSNECLAFLDSMYIMTKNSGNLYLKDMIKIAYLNNRNYLDTIANFISSFPSKDSLNKKVIINLRLFDCNIQQKTLKLNKEETLLCFRYIVNYVENEQIKIKISEYIAYLEKSIHQD